MADELDDDSDDSIPEGKQRTLQLQDGTVTADDGVSPITVEQYYQSRVQGLLQKMRRDSHRLHNHQVCSDMAIFSCGVLASLLGAFHSSGWIPVVLGISGMIASFAAFQGRQRHLQASNKAFAKLTRLRLKWQVHSFADRSLPHFKTEIIVESERCALQVAEAWVGSSIMNKADDQKPNSKNKKKGADANTQPQQKGGQDEQKKPTNN